MITDPSLLWLVIVGGIACFFMAYVTGANDIANTFSTSIGSKAISFGKAIAVAFFFETLGASLLGGTVTDAIRTKIINFELFQDAPEFLMLGMCCALIGASLWLAIATYAGIPVSTTHSIIGALAGFGIATGSMDTVKWKTILEILVSWITAPLLAGTASAITFSLLRIFVLRKRNSFEIIKKTYWILILFITLPFSVFLVFHNPIVINSRCKMLREKLEIFESPCYIQEWSAANTTYSVMISIGMSVFLTIIASSIVYIIYNKRIENYRIEQRFYEDEMFDIEKNKGIKFHSKNSSLNSVASTDVQGTQTGINTPTSNEPINENKENENNFEYKSVFNLKKFKYKIYMFNEEKKKKIIDNKVKNSELDKVDVTLETKNKHKKDILDDDANEVVIEKFDPETEIVFASLQIISAILGVVAQSANDTANAIGPFAAIYNTFNYGIKGKLRVQWYILFFGGLSMSVGLATLGYKVIRTVGIKLIKITPSRGFTVELVAGLVVLFFSILGIPLSSTHCAVSSVVGVGLVEARMVINKKKSSKLNVDTNHLNKKINENYIKDVNKASCFSCINTTCVNMKLFRRVFLSWFVTLFFSASVTAAIYSFAAYSPSYKM